MEEKLTILVADDDGDLLEATAGIIRKTGHNIITAVDGEDALEKLQQNHPDLVLTDIEMPKIDGLQLCKTIKNDPAFQHILVVLITASKVRLEQQMQALETVADGYLVRPISNKSLLAWVKSFCRIAHSEKALLQANRRIQHLNYILNSIRKINRLITQELQPKELMEKASELLTQSMGYYNVCIVLSDSNGRFESVAKAGDFSGKFPEIQRALENNQRLECFELACKSKTFCVIEHPKQTCTISSLINNPESHCMFCAELKYESSTYGFIIVSVPKEYAHENDEQDLFEELVRDLSFALHRNEINTKKLQIERQNALYAKIVETTTNILAVLDRDYRYVVVNNGYKKHIGLSGKELEGKRVVDILGEDDFKTTAKKNMDKAFRGKHVHYTAKIMNKDGKWVYHDVHLSPYKDPDGKINHLILSAVDLTEVHQHQQELKQSQDRYQWLFDASPVPLWEEDFSQLIKHLESIKEKGITDLRVYFRDYPDEVANCIEKIKILDVNHATLEFHEARNKESLLNYLETVFTPKSQEAFVEELITIFEGKDVFTTEAEIKTITGKLKQIFLKLRLEKRQPDDYKAVVSTMDITERKRAENILQESEQKFRKMFENTSVGVAIVGLDYQIRQANSAFCNMLGYSEKELKTKTIKDITYPEDWPKNQNMQKKLGQQVVPKYELEKRFVRKDGKLVWGLLNANLVEDSVGEPLFFLGNVVNISERKAMEDALLNSEEKFRSLFNLTTDALFIVDFTGKIIEANKTASDLLGYPYTELVTYSLSEFQPEDAIKDFDRISKTQLNHGLALFETYFRTKDGRHILVEASSKLIDFMHKKVVLAQVHDITQRKEAELELQKSRERYMNLFTDSASVMLLIDPKTGKIIDVNHEAEAYYGYEKEALLSMNINDINVLAPEDDMKNIELAASKKRHHYFVTQKLSSGKQREVEVFSGQVEIEDQTLLYAIIHDITERIAAEHAVEKRLAYESLLANISKLAIEESDEKVFINNSFRLIGDVFSVCRVYIFEYNSTKENQSNTYEWVTKGCASQIDHLQDIPVNVTPWRQEMMLKKRVINVENIEKIPSETEKELLQQQEIKSLLVVPMYVSGAYYGFLGLDECRVNKHWPKEDVEILTSIASIFSTYIGHRKADQALKLSQEHYQRLFELPQDFVFLHEFQQNDETGYFIEVNQWACERLKYSLDELRHMRPTDLINKKDKDLLREESETLSASGELKIVKNLLTKDGDAIPVELHARVFEHEGKKLVISIGRDISERLRTEKEIRESEDRFRGIFNNMANGVIIYEAINQGDDFVVKEINRAGMGLTKHHSEVEVGKRLSTLKAGSKHMGMMEMLKKVLDTGKAEYLPTREITTQKREIWLENYIFRITNGEVIVVFEDVSERKHYTEALRKSAEKYRLLANNATDIIWQMDLKMRFTYVSPSVFNITGFTVSEWMTMNLSDHKTMNNMILLERNILNSLKNKNHMDVISFESQILKKDGSTIDVEISAKVIRNEKGKSIGIQGSIRDITERKQAERELIESQQSLQSIFKASPIGIGLVVGRKFYRVNDTFCQMVGYSQSELLEKNTRMIYPSQDEYDRIGKDHYIQIAKEGLAFTITQYKRKDGKIIDIHLRSTKMEMYKDQIGIIFTAIDVTEQLKASKALQESEAKFRMVINAIKDVFWIQKPDFTEIIFCSPAYEEVFGRPLSELMAFPTTRLDYMNEDDRTLFNEAFANSLKTKESYTLEYRIVMPDGAIKWILERGFPIIDANNDIEFVAGSSTDISEMKSLINERFKLQDQLRQSQKMEAIGQLAGGVAHDFNNILQATLGYSQLLKDSLENSTTEYEFVEEIYNGTERAAGLTRQLLAFSRRQVIELVDVDLNQLIENLTKMMRRLIGATIELKMELKPKLATISGDVGQIEQILMNLSVNARDAMPEGGQLQIITQEITIDDDFCKANHWAQKGNYVQLRVSDNGCGIEPEIQEKIFEPFFTTKPLGEGTGLGLSTVYGIIKQLNGFIFVDSKPGEGSTFNIYFPIIKAPKKPVKPQTEIHPKRGSETILIAEDDEALRKLVCKILSDYGYRVLDTPDGEDAINVGKESIQDIQLALLDIVMPKKNGKTVMKELRKLNPDLPVLLISGYSPGGIHTNFILEQGVDYIQKPFNINKMLSKIRDLLDKKEN